MRRRPPLLRATLLILMSIPLSRARAAMLAPITGPHAPDSLLVQYRAQVTGLAQENVTRQYGERATPLSGRWAVVSLAPGTALAAALKRYAHDPAVAAVQPNYIYRMSALPNDSYFGQQWSLYNTGQYVTGAQDPYLYNTGNPGLMGADINVVPAWHYVRDCSSVIVAVLDTGVNYQQRDLAPEMWSAPGFPDHGYDFVGHTIDPMDLAGHGTHVAGIIGAAGNDSTGITGVCQKARLMAVRVLDTTGAGTTAGIVQGLGFALAHGARIINMSLGGSVFDPALSDAIGQAQQAGALVVVSAGNEGANNDNPATPTYPCDDVHANLVCVAALDQRGALAQFSNYGHASVALAAPGTNILSTWAGSETIQEHSLSSGWTFSQSVPGWAYSSYNGHPVLANPPAWPATGYISGATEQAYKTLFVPGGSSAVARFAVSLNVATDGSFAVAYGPVSGNPFLSQGGTLFSGINGDTGLHPSAMAYDISRCLGVSCTIGVGLTAGAAADLGIAVMQFEVDTLCLNLTSYNVISGTSMAAPEVAGIAALVWAYNPEDSALDVADAIKFGGRHEDALSGVTSTGNAADAMGSLAYINAPAGVSATVQ